MLHIAAWPALLRQRTRLRTSCDYSFLLPTNRLHIPTPQSNTTVRSYKRNDSVLPTTLITLSGLPGE
jgi:hypothetical protein